MEADMWSIGVEFFELIYGRQPFPAKDNTERIKNIMNTKPNYSGVEISAEFRDFIERCLTIDPEERINWEEVYDHPMVKNKT